MKHLKFLMGMIAAMSIVSTALAVEKKAPVAGKPDAKKMAAAQKMAAPGPNHKRLEGLIGKWTHSVKFWMSPEGKPQESKGTNENRWILGGRFVQADHKGTVMGKPFEGVGISGYDNVRGEYTSLWLDNMNTGTMMATGQYDAATGSIVEQGTYSCPMTNEKSKPYRGVVKVVDANHYTYTSYMKDDKGNEFKSMEISYERAQ